MPKDEQQEIKLDYGSKVFSSLTDVGQRGHRAFFVSILLASGLILFSAGVIKVEQPIDIFGITISAPTLLLLVVGALVVAGMHLSVTSLASEQRRLHNVLLANYASLGFNPPRGQFEPTWTPLLYPDGASVVLSAIQREIFEPMALKPLLSTLRTMLEEGKRPWGLLFRFVVSAVTISFSILILLFLPVIAEIWAIIRAAQILNGGNGLLWLAAIVLVIVNIAILLLSRQAVAESLPETRAALGSAVLPILQDVERNRMKVGDNGSGPTEDNLEGVPPLGNPS